MFGDDAYEETSRIFSVDKSYNCQLDKHGKIGKIEQNEIFPCFFIGIAKFVSLVRLLFS